MELDFDNGKIYGDALFFTLDGQQLACETSCEFTFNQDMKQVSAYMAGGWQHVIPGIRSWQINVAGNFLTHFNPADFKTILAGLLSRKQFQIAMRTQSDYSPAFMIGGYAYPTSGSLGSSVNDLVSFTTVFQGNGPLNYSSEASEGDFWRILNANPAPADKPIYVQSTL